MFKVAGSTLATQKVSSSSHDKNAYAEREVTATITKKTKPVAGVMPDRSMLARFSFSSQGLKVYHDASDFSSFLYAELLSQLVACYACVLQELWMIRGEIARKTNKFVSFSEWIDTNNRTFDKIRMSLNLHNNRSARLFQEAESQYKTSPFSAMHCKIDNRTNDCSPLNTLNKSRRSSATYHSPHVVPLLFSNTPLPTIAAASYVERVILISRNVLDSLGLFQDPCATISWSLGHNYPRAQVQDTIRTPLPRVVNYRSYQFLNTR